MKSDVQRDTRFHGFGMKNPPPPKASIEDATLIPEATAGWFSLLTFEWLTPLLSLGYARPLEASDLYKLQDDRSAAYIADKIMASFEARRTRANEYNERLANGQVKAGWRNIIWTLRGNRADREKRWREVQGKRKASLALAMNDSVKWFVSVPFPFYLVHVFETLYCIVLVRRHLESARRHSSSHFTPRRKSYHQLRY